MQYRLAKYNPLVVYRFLMLDMNCSYEITHNEESISVTEMEQSINTTEPTSNTEFCEPKPKNKKQKLPHLKTMVKELNEITAAVNYPEESKFEVFGKHVRLQQ